MADESRIIEIVPPVNTPAMTPEEAAKGHDTVTMVFEKPVTLTVQHGKKVHYTRGVHEVPRQYADHWYLKVHGVTAYSKPVSVIEPAAEESAKSKKK